MTRAVFAGFGLVVLIYAVWCIVKRTPMKKRPAVALFGAFADGVAGVVLLAVAALDASILRNRELLDHVRPFIALAALSPLSRFVGVINRLRKSRKSRGRSRRRRSGTTTCRRGRGPVRRG